MVTFETPNATFYASDVEEMLDAPFLGMRASDFSEEALLLVAWLTQSCPLEVQEFLERVEKNRKARNKRGYA